MLGVVEEWVAAQLTRGAKLKLPARSRMAVPPPTQAAVAKLVAAVGDACLTALTNLGPLLHELAHAAPPPSSAALALLRQQQQQLAGLAPGSPSGAEGIAGSGSSGPLGLASFSISLPVSTQLLASAASAPSFSAASRLLSAAAARSGASGGSGEPGLSPEAWVRSEYGAVWQEVQEEVTVLLAELLAAPLRGLPAQGGGKGCVNEGVGGGQSLERLWLAGYVLGALLLASQAAVAACCVLPHSPRGVTCGPLAAHDLSNPPPLPCPQPEHGMAARLCGAGREGAGAGHRRRARRHGRRRRRSGRCSRRWHHGRRRRRRQRGRWRCGSGRPWWRRCCQQAEIHL